MCILYDCEITKNNRGQQMKSNTILKITWQKKAGENEQNNKE